jgi:hypothetical protein
VNREDLPEWTRRVLEGRVLVKVECATCKRLLYGLTEAHLLDQHVTAGGGGLPVPVCKRHPYPKPGALARHHQGNPRASRVFVPLADLRDLIAEARRAERPRVYRI